MKTRWAVQARTCLILLILKLRNIRRASVWKIKTDKSEGLEGAVVEQDFTVWRPIYKLYFRSPFKNGGKTVSVIVLTLLVRVGH